MKITVNIDWIGYTVKPTCDEVVKITSRIRAIEPKEMNLEEFAAEIKQGKTFISGSIKNKALKKLCADNTKDFAFFGLDIDNKELKLTSKEVIEEVRSKLNIIPFIAYETFSSTQENKRFRLLYLFKTPIKKHEEFADMYKQLKILFPTMIDKSTSNANRLWYATNKENVFLFKNYTLIDFKDFKKELNKIVPLDKRDSGIKAKNINYTKVTKIDIDDVFNCISFYKDKVTEIAEYVIHNIPIENYVTDVGGLLKDHGNYYTCSCPFHGGDNERGFVIYKNSKSAFCHTHNCVAGDVINLCKAYENLDYFGAIRSLLNRYSLGIPEEYFYFNKYELKKELRNEIYGKVR